MDERAYLCLSKIHHSHWMYSTKLYPQSPAKTFWARGVVSGTSNKNDTRESAQDHEPSGFTLLSCHLYDHRLHSTHELNESHVNSIFIPLFICAHPKIFRVLKKRSERCQTLKSVQWILWCHITHDRGSRLTDGQCERLKVFFSHQMWSDHDFNSWHRSLTLGSREVAGCL